MSFPFFLAANSIMPNNCSAPGCRRNYDKDERISVFKLPQTPDQLRHAWFRALHRDDIDKLKVVYICKKHFRDEHVGYTHRVPNGDGSYREIPRSKLKLKEDTVPSILPGLSSILFLTLRNQTQSSVS